MKRLILLLGLLTVQIASAADAVPLPVGKSRVECEAGDVVIQVFTYKPANYRDGPLLVVFHGKNRNAEDYRDWAVPLADEQGYVVAAPLFDERRFPGDAYLRGNVVSKDGTLKPPSEWTFPKVLTVIEMLRAAEKKPAWPYLCIGHSAGGQFAERFAAFQPNGALRIVAANPGTHLFPNEQMSGGYGFGSLPASLGGDEGLKRYLAAPLTIYLGTADNDPNHQSLDNSAAAKLQGPHRLARGRACFEAAEKLAKDRSWPFAWRKVETPCIAHEGGRMLAAPEAVQALRP